MDATYYLPLSYALEFPRLRFGCAEIRGFTESELSEAWRIDELSKHGPSFVPDVHALCRFQYLVVRSDTRSGRWNPPGTTVQLNLHPDNLERVAVYERRFPPIVDRAIFCLLLQPIEDGAHYGLDWRPFETPVLYERHDDPEHPPRLPPDPSKLVWETCFTEDGDEYKRPMIRGESDQVGLEQELQDTWQLLERLLPLDGVHPSAVNRLVERFVLRAYEQGCFDGLVMHMIALDAMLGPDSPPTKGPIKKRIVKLLRSTGDDGLALHAGDEFDRLFDMRNNYLHGKMQELELPCRRVDPFIQDIIGAHALARRVILAACRFVRDSGLVTRETFFEALDT